MSFCPGQIVRLGGYGAKSHPDARFVFAASFFGFSVDAIDLIFGLFQRLAPESEDVCQAASDSVGFVLAAADGDGDRFAVDWTNAVLEVLEVVVLAAPVEGVGRFPGAFEDVDVLFQTAVALALEKEVSFPSLFGIVAACDEVHNRATFAELVEGGEGFGCYCWVEGVGA